METLNLNQAVPAYREMLNDPAKFNLDIKPMKDCFAVADECTANHILFRQYCDAHVGQNLPKLIFYILMMELFGQCNGKDETNNLGYYLKVIP